MNAKADKIVEGQNVILSTVEEKSTALQASVTKSLELQENMREEQEAIAKGVSQTAQGVNALGSSLEGLHKEQKEAFKHTLTSIEAAQSSLGSLEEQSKELSNGQANILVDMQQSRTALLKLGQAQEAGFRESQSKLTELHTSALEHAKQTREQLKTQTTQLATAQQSLGKALTTQSSKLVCSNML
jgi:uncharacterized phage infection (PIP) family protein YhgE